MAQIPVLKETHAQKRLKPLESFEFLAKFPVCELVMAEFAAAAAIYPIFFIEREGSYSPVALLSLIDGQNLFVEADGSWSGHYIPAAFRRYPFSVGNGEVNGQQGPVLMVEEDALSDSEGELIFGATPEEEANGPLARVMRLIGETDRSHLQTRELIAELTNAGLIRSADLTVQLQGQKHNIGGLFGVDEAKLQALPDEEFLKLRHSGALALAHIQLQSVGQIQRLIQRHHRRDAGETAGKGVVD
jgi:hypothetical protein